MEMDGGASDLIGTGIRMQKDATLHRPCFFARSLTLLLHLSLFNASIPSPFLVNVIQYLHPVLAFHCSPRMLGSHG